MMCHQTNLDCKSFSVSEDVVNMSVALTLKVAKAFFFFFFWYDTLAHDDASPS